MKKKDLLIIAAILLVALLAWWVYFGGKSRGNYAEVIFDGNVVKTVYLDEDMTFSLSEMPQIEFEIKDGAIAFTHSSCPDQVCVYTGWLNEPNQFAACLPNRTLIWVSTDEKNPKSPDAVAK